MLFLDVITTISAALLIGNEIAVWIFINPVLWKLEENAQAQAITLFAVRLGAAMPFWYALTLLLLITETVVHTRGIGYLLLIASCSIWIAVVVLTLLFLVPINNRLASLRAGSLPVQARQEHHKWNKFHQWRIAGLSASLVCLLLGIRL
jgi:uncharacterized membrane protein